MLEMFQKSEISQGQAISSVKNNRPLLSIEVGPRGEPTTKWLQIICGPKLVRMMGVIKWAVVRPDGLTDEEQATEYEAFPSPIRSALFEADKISRINVAHFMAELIADDELWQKWKGKMPVLYEKSSV